MPAAFASKELIMSMLVENLQENGQVLTPAQREQAEAILASEQGKRFMENQLVVAQQALPPIVDLIFNQLEANFDTVVNDVISPMGVFCVTEDARNQQMWAHYADQGRGFVVGFDAQHPFFYHCDGSTQRHLLKKVIYTDKHTENFWRNPYYLFLVKSPGWAYEKEWRMLKKFKDSDEAVLSVTPAVHLWNVAPDMITSVHFGYKYSENELAADMASMMATGARPRFYRLAVNRAEGTLEEQCIN